MTSRALAALFAAVILSLTGCSSGPADGPSAAEPKTAEASTDPAAAATEEPSESPALIEREKDKEGQYKDGTRDSTGGIVAWDVQPGPGLTKPLGLRLGAMADPFLTEHVLREDRWIGSHIVKAGEMDALAKETTPQLFAKVERAVTWLDRALAKHDGDATKLLGKTKKQMVQNVQIAGHFMLMADVVEGGTGRARFEVTRKVVYVPDSGDFKGLPTTWIYVKTRKENNTGTGREFAISQSWKQVDGKWLITNSSWGLR